MRFANFVMFAINLLLFGLVGYFVVSHGLAAPPANWEYKDLIAIILTALGAILTTLAIVIGLMAIWGYSSIRDAAVRAAQTRAEEIAAQVATDTAEPIATRVAAETAARTTTVE